MCAAALLALLVPVHADGPSLGAAAQEGVEASAATGELMGARRLSEEPGVFTTRAALQTAVDDFPASESTHGSISGWDVSLVDDMSGGSCVSPDWDCTCLLYTSPSPRD